MVLIPEQWITFINLAVIVFLVVLIILGAKKGFFLQIVTLCGTILAFFLSYRFCGVLADYFVLWPKEWTPFDNTLLQDAVYQYFNEIAWFFVIFIVLVVIFKLLEPIAKGLQKIPLLKQLSTILGAVLGFFNALVWIVVFSMILNMPMFENGTKINQDTYIGQITDQTTKIVTVFAGPVLNSQAFADLISGEANFGDSDQQAVRDWLESHGYETVENNEPQATVSPTPSIEPSVTPTQTTVSE